MNISNNGGKASFLVRAVMKMFKKDSKMATPKMATPKKKFDKLTLIIYSVVGIIFFMLCLTAGRAFDLAMTSDGKIAFSKLESSFVYASQHFGECFKYLFNSKSHVSTFGIISLMAMGIFVLYQMTKTPKRTHRQGVEYGSAKWGDKKEIAQLADPQPATSMPIKRNGKRVFDDDGNFVCAKVDTNIIISEDVRLALNCTLHMLNLNMLIIGGAGSGKTRFFAKPNIMQLNTSFVITDPKGEILRDTGKMLEEAGYEIKVFNTIDMTHSSNYNPFAYIYDFHGRWQETRVKQMVEVLFTATKGSGEKEDFWSQKGKTLLEAVIVLLIEESEYNVQYDENGYPIHDTIDKSHLNFFSVGEKLRRLQYPPRGGQQPDGYFLEQMPNETDEAFEKRRSQAFLCSLDKDFIELKKRNPMSNALKNYADVRNAPEETGQSYVGSANVKISLFNMTQLRNLTSTDTIHLETIGDKKTALFMLIPATDRTFNFLPSMMYSQMFNTLEQRANFKYGGKLPVHVRCIMDEFANIGQIPDLDNVVTFVRSAGISLCIILQTLSQLKSKYEKTWETISGVCDTLLFLGGQEESTLKFLSEKLGKETIDVRGENRTKGKQSSTSENNSILGRELMQLNEISTMPITDCIITMRSHNPFYSHKYPLEQHPNYHLLADADRSRTYDIDALHTITMEEVDRQTQQRKVDTNINFSGAENVPQDTVIENVQYTFFSDPHYTVIPTSYLEVEELLSAEPNELDVNEEYTEPNQSEQEFFGDSIYEEITDFGTPISKKEESHEENPVSAVTDSEEAESPVPVHEPEVQFDEKVEHSEVNVDAFGAEAEGDIEAELAVKETYASPIVASEDFTMHDTYFDM